MILVWSILIVPGTVYFLFLASVAFGFSRLREHPGESAERAGFVSVVIAARNEEASISKCLESLLASDYADDSYEIIVVDDHSTDGTAALVTEVMARSGVVRLVSLDDSLDNHSSEHNSSVHSVGGGKATALNAGIAAARGDLIVTTDADCTVSRRWLASNTLHLSYSPVVAGAVFYGPARSLFENLQRLEFFGLVSIGAGCIGLARPSICNSSNLAYRKSILSSVAPDGFRNEAGSDELLIQEVGSAGLGNPVFNIDPEAYVQAQPERSLNGFIEQRKRWAAATLHFRDPLILAVSIAIFVFLAILTVATLLAFVFPSLAMPVLAAWTVKLVADLLVLLPAARHFNKMDLLKWFLPAELVHPPYIVAASAIGALTGKHWKARTP